MARAVGGRARQPYGGVGLGPGARGGSREGLASGRCPVLVLVPPRVLERVAKMARWSVGNRAEGWQETKADSGAGEGALRRGIPRLDARRPSHSTLPAGGERDALAGSR